MGYTLPRKFTKIIFISVVMSFLTGIMPFLSFTQPAGDIAFGDTEFAAPDPPTLAFTTSSLSVNENNRTATVEVELTEANGTAVDVDVVFVSGSSSASGSDIGSYSTRTISFSSNDASNTTKTITVPITDDADYESTETVTFQLKNNTAGSIGEPGLLNLTILDNDAPDIAINEIHANPDDVHGDANGDGSPQNIKDEFVEFLNNESTDIDISGWTLSDDAGVKYTFPSGAVISAGNAAVVFGGGSPAGNFGGANIFISDGLGLSNAGATIELADGEGNIVAEYTYGPEGGDSQSITRDPDSRGSFVKHSTAIGSNETLFSPGTKIDGSPFGSKYAIGIRGSEGWRMISTPTQNTSFKDFFSNFWMQGLTGSDAPAEEATIYEWEEQGGGTFLTPADMSDEMEAGKGYIVYLFEDDEFNTPGVQGGFPKIINSNKAENNRLVTVAISSEDADGNNTLSGSEGWNLLGNPFGTDILVDEVLAAVRTALQSRNADYDVNANIHVWDPSADGGDGEHIALAEDSGKTIAPFQAFWIRVDTVENSTAFTVNAAFERNRLAADEDIPYYEERNRESFGFSISLGDGTYYDQYQVVFNKKGSVDLDPHDAYKLFSLKSNSINLYSLAGENKLMKNVLPVELDASIEVPLNFDAPDRESLNLNWDRLENLPDGWKVTLFDRELNREINLSSANDYSFSIPGEADKEKVDTDAGKPQLNKTKAGSEESRFVLSISPAASETTQASDIPESVKLNPNYPNPFNPTTTISYELKEDSEVLLSVWNIVGQKVVTLVDEMKEAGQHTATWNASELPSGIYIAQLEVAGEVFIRKMTLIK